MRLLWLLCAASFFLSFSIFPLPKFFRDPSKILPRSLKKFPQKWLRSSVAHLFPFIIIFTWFFGNGGCSEILRDSVFEFFNHNYFDIGFSSMCGGASCFSISFHSFEKKINSRLLVTSPTIRQWFSLAKTKKNLLSGQTKCFLPPPSSLPPLSTRSPLH